MDPSSKNTSHELLQEIYDTFHVQGHDKKVDVMAIKRNIIDTDKGVLVGSFDASKPHKRQASQ